MKILKIIIIVIFFLSSLSSCRNSKIDECVDKKIKQGMSSSEAREDCESEYADSKIRR